MNETTIHLCQVRQSAAGSAAFYLNSQGHPVRVAELPKALGTPRSNDLRDRPGADRKRPARAAISGRLDDEARQFIAAICDDPGERAVPFSQGSVNARSAESVTLENQPYRTA